MELYQSVEASLRAGGPVLASGFIGTLSPTLPVYVIEAWRDHGLGGLAGYRWDEQVRDIETLGPRVAWALRDENGGAGYSMIYARAWSASV